ncbi:MAG: reverse transcriptase domain-containing protein [Anaeroplasmataceae bacterium]
MKINLSKELKDVDNFREVQKDLFDKGASSKEIEEVMDSLNLDVTSHQWSIPKKVQIPKDNGIDTRDVYIFDVNDNNLLKVINKIFNTKLSQELSDNVYSYRPKVGISMPCSKLVNFLGVDRTNYIKCDISSYFNSVPQRIIFKALSELIEDEDGLELMKRLFRLNKYKDKYGNVYDEYLGLMPGTATSSYLSNYVLKELDNQLSNKSQFYARYSDDFVVVDKDLNTITDCYTLVKEELDRCDLKLNEDKTLLKTEVNEVTFLGLTVTRNSIDLSPENFLKIKKIVKKLLKDERKRLELTNRRLELNDVARMIRAINRNFYGGYLKDMSKHKSSKLVFLFQSITTDSTLKELDYYLLDSLRAFYTGVNNKANANRLTTNKLEELGFRSTVQMFNLYKSSKPCFVHKVHTITRQEGRSLTNCKPFGMIKDSEKFRSIVTTSSFFEILSKVYLNDGYIIVDGFKYNVTDVIVDLINKIISVDKNILVEGNSIQEPLQVHMAHDNYSITFINPSISSNEIDKELLMNFYHNSFIQYYSKASRNSYYSQISFKTLISNGFVYNERFNSPTMFSILMYSYLFSEDCISSADLSKEYVTIGDRLPLVFETKLIPR